MTYGSQQAFLAVGEILRRLHETKFNQATALADGQAGIEDAGVAAIGEAGGLGKEESEVSRAPGGTRAEDLRASQPVDSAYRPTESTVARNYNLGVEALRGGSYPMSSGHKFRPPMKDNAPSTIPIAGDCYEASFKNGQELAAIKGRVESPNTSPDQVAVVSELRPIYEKLRLSGDICIVHGWVTPGAGPAKGKRVHHAWIEVGDATVIETQGGTRQQRSKAEYYATFMVSVERVYSIQEAEVLVATYQKLGRWNAMSRAKT